MDGWQVVTHKGAKPKVDTRGNDDVQMRRDEKPHHVHKPKHSRRSKIFSTPTEPTLVPVYVGDEFVQAVPLKLLVRFSKVAADTFPKPKRESEDDNGEDDGATEKRGWQSGRDTGSGVRPPPGQPGGPPLITNDYAEFMAIPGYVSKPTEPQGEEAIAAAHDNPPTKQVLRLGFPEVKEYPSIEAVTSCLSWMNRNRNKKHSEHLTNFTVSGSKAAEIPLTTLVDLHASVLCFKMRPIPYWIRDEVMERLTAEKPLQVDIQFIWEHLPASDAVVKRMIWCAFESWATKIYTDEEARDVIQYVGSVPALDCLFFEIYKKRCLPPKQGEEHPGGDVVEEKQRGSADVSRAVGRGEYARSAGSRRAKGDGWRARREQKGRGDGAENAKGQLGSSNAITQASPKGANGDIPKATKATKTSGQEISKPKAERWLAAERMAEERARQQE